MPRCAPNMMCIQVMPAPLIVNLSVVKIEQTECSVRYTATTPANVKAIYTEKVTVDDFTASFTDAEIYKYGFFKGDAVYFVQKKS